MCSNGANDGASSLPSTRRHPVPVLPRAVCAGAAEFSIPTCPRRTIGQMYVELVESAGRSARHPRPWLLASCTGTPVGAGRLCRTQAPGPGRPTGGLPSGVWYTPAAAPLPAGAGEEARGPLDSGSPSPRLSQPASGKPLIVDAAARTGTITLSDRKGSPAYF